MKRLVYLVLTVAMMLTLMTPGVQAQGAYSLTTALGNTIAGTSYYGPAFTLTALKSTKLHRFKMCLSTGTANIAIWAHPNTVTYANDGQWICLGTATIPSAGTSVYTEIPIDLNFMMNAGETWGFIVFYNGGGATPRYLSSAAPLTYADSYLSMNTAFTLVTATTPQTAPPTGFAFTWGNRKFSGVVMYDEGCYVPPGMHSISITDANGDPLTYTNIPGTLFAKLFVGYPTGAATITTTLNFYRIGGSQTVPEFTQTFVSQKQAGQDLNVLQQISIPSNLLPGFYRIVPVINAPNSCNQLKDMTMPETSVMLIYPGTMFCVVWPGDVNNDGMVNYGDRKSLNKYIYDANLRNPWLSGPGRYRADAKTNPLSTFAWEGQAGIPWNTDEGCYMDADGNGTVNNFDYVVMKVNWMRTHGTPKDEAPSFTMLEAWPNPFNPSTTIHYDVTERSDVLVTMTNLEGQTVATLQQGTQEAGDYRIPFTANGLSSGVYMVSITTRGHESGVEFSRMIKVTLNK